MDAAFKQSATEIKTMNTKTDGGVVAFSALAVNGEGVLLLTHLDKEGV